MTRAELIRCLQSVGRAGSARSVLNTGERSLGNAVVAEEQAAHVGAARHRRWAGAAVLVGVVYLLIGRLFSVPADHAHLWRLAAWAVSGAAFAAHILYEHIRLRSAPRSTALHAAVAVAIGGFALAVAGMVNSFLATSGIRATWLLALVVWPLVTGLPAFLVALLAAAILARFPRGHDG